MSLIYGFGEPSLSPPTRRHCPECEGCADTVQAEMSLRDHLEECADQCTQPCDVREALENPCDEEREHRVCVNHDPLDTEIDSVVD